MEITLKCRLIIWEKYTGSTKFEFYKNLRVNDVILIESPFIYPKGNRGHAYAKTIKLTNERTGESFTDTLRLLMNRLDKIKYEEYIENS